MEIHLQKCQSCGSTELENIIFRESGEPDKIFARCRQCHKFVASYTIAPLGYFHNGKGYKSFLRGVVRSGLFMSGRRIQRKFEERKSKELESFDYVEDLLAKKQKEKMKED